MDLIPHIDLIEAFSVPYRINNNHKKVVHKYLNYPPLCLSKIELFYYLKPRIDISEQSESSEQNVEASNT